MEEIIKRYKDGDKYAEDTLLDHIQESHNYKIDRHEAKILLYKKYGKVEVF